MRNKYQVGLATASIIELLAMGCSHSSTVTARFGGGVHNGQPTAAQMQTLVTNINNNPNLSAQQKQQALSELPGAGGAVGTGQ